MSVVYYQAINAHGEVINGEWVGNKGDLQSFLKAQKITLIRTKSNKSRFFKQKVPPIIMADLCFQLMSLVRNGVHLTKSIQLIAEQKTLKYLQNSLMRIQDFLNQGYSISEAFKASESVFPNIFLQNLSMAERTGEVLTTLEKLHSFFLWQHESLYKVKQMIRYPLLLLCVLVVFLLVVFRVLLPNILVVMHDNTLPIAKNFFLESLLFISHHELQVLGLLVFMVLLGLLSVWTAKNRNVQDSKVFNFFGVAQYIALYQTAILLRNLSMLLQVGINLKQALSILIEDLPTNVLLRKIFNDVSEGSSFFGALENQKVFTATSLGMIQVAERSGTLPHVLQTISELYTNLFKQKLEKLISWTQPFLIVIMGGILIWIVLAIFLPLYESIAEIKF